MPTRLLLEGPDIETLLAQVRDEHGGQARIVSAEKVRTGGVAGFFARQRFELAVEVDELAEPARTAAPEPTERAGEPAVEPAAASVADLLAQADAREQRLTRPGPPVAAASERVPEREPERVPDREPERVPEHAPERVPERVAERVPEREPEDFAAVLGLVRRRFAAPTAVELAGEPDPVVPAEPVDAGVQPFRPPVLDPAEDGYRAAIRASRAARSAEAAPLVPAQPPAAPVVPLVPGAPVVAPVGAGTPRELAGLGVPAGLAALATGPDRYAAALAALRTLPAAAPAPAGPGQVLAVVGDTEPAFEVAEQVSRELCLDPRKILVAGPAGPAGGGRRVPAARRILSAADAVGWVSRLHTARVPTVVVVSTPPGRAGWARGVLDALRPTAVWAVVDAGRKVTDLARHLHDLGTVDALAVHGAAGTADPGTVLGLGLPVAYLDARPATAHTWAGALCARLTAAATDGAATDGAATDGVGG